MDRDIEKLAGHYIICGAGRVGRRVANELASESAAFVIIESDAEKLRKADSGWLTMEGDATRETVLRQARIEHAQGLVAATTTDATNIYIVLTARSLNPKFKIIARASEEAAEKHLHTAGADVVISPYSFAGHRIAQRFLRPNVLDFLDVATTRSGTFGMVIEELQVANVSPLAGKTIGSSHIHHEFGAIVLAIKRPNGETMFNPRADAPIMAGDYLILMGEAASLEKLEGLNAASAMTP